MREKVRADILAKFMKSIGRGERKNDLKDVREMVERGLVDPSRLLQLFSQVDDKLYKYPAIDAKSLRQAVEQLAKERE